MTSSQTVPGKGTVAVIDDDDAARISIGQMLRLRRYRTELFSSADAALGSPVLNDVDCIVTDIKMPGMDGETFLTEMLRRNHPAPIIMITGHGDVSMAVRCLKSGAYDFVEKPFEDDVLLASVGRGVEKHQLRCEGDALRRRLALLEPEEDGRFGLVGRSRVIQDVFAQIEVAARSNATVLIYGETGVGKELVARAIHEQSSRADRPFVPVNAGALPDTMLDSDLFGHARGAFTGADTDRDGKLVTADGGTLLLDEIESISERAQVQLLRVLEDGMVQPLGRDTVRHVDVRLLATTKADLMEQVRTGRMRQDFYHRIMVLTIAVPPLREHLEDIPLLLSHFAKTAAIRHGIPLPQFPEETLDEMMHHNWPGNIRELRNAVERMTITADHGIAGPFVLDDAFAGARLLSLPATIGRLRDEMENTEKNVIESALRECKGEVNATSRVLGISRRALYERMRKYELNRESYRI